MDNELIELCKPIVEYIKRNFDPYTEVCITDGSIKIKETTAYEPMHKS